MTPAVALDALRKQTPRMVEALEALVSVETPSSAVDALHAGAAVLADLGASLLGARPEMLDAGGKPFLVWRFGTGAPEVVLLGHLDTVWPQGTTGRWPFTVSPDGARATGPGVFDMKAGIVQGLFALSTLDDVDGVAVIVNADEEIGSLGSRTLIERVAAGARAALVLEPAAGGAVKTGRKGVSFYDIDVEGRAAHAGLEPEKGVNATVELAHRVLALLELADAAAGTTVTPTTATAGSSPNTVPAAATLHVDVRAATVGEQQRVDAALRTMAVSVEGALVSVRGGPNRPPFEESRSAALFARAASVAQSLGLAPLRSVVVGGGSDGNFTAGIGVATLDGLGAVGDHAHAEGEYVDVPSMPERAALVAGLVDALLAEGRDRADT
jgi:glutamate carboxypeptidase